MLLRTKEDGRIDWGRPAQDIHNLARALTRPYVGAHFDSNGEEIKVWKTELVSGDGQMMNMEPGKIVEVKGNEMTIKCGEVLLRLIEHSYDISLRRGDYL